VRAEVTYLRQDFSVPLEVANPGKWPDVQRFDFMIRERPATAADFTAAQKAEKGPTAHQQSVFFALRELTGADPGPRVEDWKKHFLKKELKVNAVFTGLKNARGIAAGDGALFVCDSGVILRKSGDARPTAWLKDASGLEALTFGPKAGLLALTGRSVLKIDLTKRETSALPAKLEGKRFQHPRRIVSDRSGGVYLSDDPDPDALRDRGSVHYVSAHGSVTKLPVSLARPRGLALTADGRTLYVGSSSVGDVMAYAVESAGSLGKGKRLARVGTATADLAADGRGNVIALDGAGQSVVVIAPSGAKLAFAKLPDSPIACAVRDTTLFVLTKKAIYSVDLAPADTTRTAR
jgi:sugar lactone lactonase YvrE